MPHSPFILQVTTGPRVIILKVPSLSMRFWTSSEENLKNVIAFRDSNSLIPLASIHRRFLVTVKLQNWREKLIPSIKFAAFESYLQQREFFCNLFIFLKRSNSVIRVNKLIDCKKKTNIQIQVDNLTQFYEQSSVLAKKISCSMSKFVTSQFDCIGGPHYPRSFFPRVCLFTWKKTGLKCKISSQFELFYLRIQYSRSKEARRKYRKYREYRCLPLFVMYFNVLFGFKFIF